MPRNITSTDGNQLRAKGLDLNQSGHFRRAGSHEVLHTVRQWPLVFARTTRIGHSLVIALKNSILGPCQSAALKPRR
jgi:hypothetical protein